jgi:hypothetical protein
MQVATLTAVHMDGSRSLGRSALLTSLRIDENLVLISVDVLEEHGVVAVSIFRIELRPLDFTSAALARYLRRGIDTFACIDRERESHRSRHRLRIEDEPETWPRAGGGLIPRKVGLLVRAAAIADVLGKAVEQTAYRIEAADVNVDVMQQRYCRVQTACCVIVLPAAPGAVVSNV